MRPTITQREALGLGVTAGFQTGGFTATAILVIAHFLNPRVSWYYPAFTLSLAIASSLLHSILVDDIMRAYLEYRSNLQPKK